MWAVTCDFQQCGILTSVDSYEAVQLPFKLRNSKCFSVSSLTLIEYNQVTCKGSDQTVHMHRLICAFAGCTYHTVGNLMSWLMCIFYHSLLEGKLQVYEIIFQDYLRWQDHVTPLSTVIVAPIGQIQLMVLWATDVHLVATVVSIITLYLNS